MILILFFWLTIENVLTQFGLAIQFFHLWYLFSMYEICERRQSDKATRIFLQSIRMPLLIFIKQANIHSRTQRVPYVETEKLSWNLSSGGIASIENRNFARLPIIYKALSWFSYIRSNEMK